MGGVYTESSVSSYMLVLFEFNAVGLIVLLVTFFLLMYSRDITYRLSIKCATLLTMYILYMLLRIILDTLVIRWQIYF